MAITAACALGAGITGTLLWVENRPAPPVKMTDSAPPEQASTGEITQGGSHVPPANLTSGMSAPEAALALGNWNYDHENWQVAVENYRSAIRGGVDNPNIRTDLGNALRFSGHPQEALQQYRLAQKQDPNHEQSLFNQGALFAVSLKNPRKGVEAWRAYLKRFPGGASATQARKFIEQYSRAK